LTEHILGGGKYLLCHCVIALPFTTVFLAAASPAASAPDNLQDSAVDGLE
jgi:hypothetical protein